VVRRRQFPLDAVADEFLGRVVGEAGRIRIGEMFRVLNLDTQRVAKAIASSAVVEARKREHAPAVAARHKRTKRETEAAHREIVRLIDNKMLERPTISRCKAASAVRRDLENEQKKANAFSPKRRREIDRMLKIKSAKHMAALKMPSMASASAGTSDPGDDVG
jgi:hypothetical protein